MRTRRIDNEWLLLEALSYANPGRLQLKRHPDAFALDIANVPALIAPPPDPACPDAFIQRSHSLRIIFPRYYPSMPSEVYLDRRVFHPNVHPDTGFVCLWTRHRILTTLEHSLAQLQRVLSWTLLNPDPEHVMQPEALRWYQQSRAHSSLSLPIIPFIPIHADSWVPNVPVRRRLS
jgi:ubiquitin-protein ligase